MLLVFVFYLWVLSGGEQGLGLPSLNQVPASAAWVCATAVQWKLLHTPGRNGGSAFLLLYRIQCP